MRRQNKEFKKYAHCGWEKYKLSRNLWHLSWGSLTTLWSISLNSQEQLLQTSHGYEL